ncbi:MAG: hypothetical protein V3U19_03725 [Thermodesulfobacteriota bacterium]
MSRIAEIHNDIKEKVAESGLPEGVNFNIFSAQQIFDYILPFLAPVAAATAAGVEEGIISEKNLVQKMLDHLVPSFVEDIKTIMEKISGPESGNDYEFAKEMYLSLNSISPMKQIIHITRIIAYLILTIYTEGSAASEQSNQDVNELKRPNILDAETLATLMFKEPGDSENWSDLLNKHGLPEAQKSAYIKAHFEEVPFEILRQMFLRGDLSAPDLDERLLRLKIRPDDKDMFKYGFRQFPGVQDIVRFAVREVWTPDAVERFQLLSEIPPDFLLEAEKIGLSQEHAKNFWAAHWELPGVQLSFEMYHRKKITRPDLRMILKAADFMPGFREDIIDVAYLVPSRVDIRRMYRYNIIDEEKVFEYYEFQGYSSEDARFLTDFVVAEYGDEVKEARMSDIKGLYKNGVITREEALEHLAVLRFKPEAAEIILLNEDAKKQEKRVKAAVKRIQKRFLTERVGEFDARLSLSNMGYENQAVDDFLIDWELEKDEAVSELSMMQIEKIFKKHIDTEEESRVRLKDKGYKESDLNKLILLWKAESL